MDSTLHRFFAPCPRGLEQLLAEEVAGLGGRHLAPTEGGVAFAGPKALVYRVNLESRIASRVLWQVGRNRYRTEHDVYRVAVRLPWPDWFTAKETIKVKVSARQCPLKSLDFVTLRIKDAVCDAFVSARASRPDVNTARPDVRIDAYLTGDEIVLYLDTSGEPLFKRGYRLGVIEAPLRENLAAGLVKLTGWSPDRPLIDPMCGGGTIVTEAAMMARSIAPGLGRRFAFERLRWFDAERWAATRAASVSGQQPAVDVPIHACDRDPRAISLAEDNLRRAGVRDDVRLNRCELLEAVAPAAAGILLTNPPYGIRLGHDEELRQFYPLLGDWLKRRFAGWTAYLFTGDLRLPKLIGLSPSRRTVLFNGALECRLYRFAIVAGGMRRHSAASKAGGHG